MGKFARVAVGTGNIDYNGRLCMVSAAGGNNKAFGVDRAANPWSDIALADVIFSAGSNTAECHPLTMPYIWEARDRGGKHHRGRPARHAQRPHRRHPSADQARHRHRPGQRHPAEMITHDWLDHDFIDTRTVGFDETAAAGERLHARRRWRASAAFRRRASRRPPRSGARPKPASSCTPAASSTPPTARTTCCPTSTWCSPAGASGRPGCGYGTLTGQGNGQGGREHGQKADQLPGQRKYDDPEARKYVASVWGIKRRGLPAPGRARSPT